MWCVGCRRNYAGTRRWCRTWQLRLAGSMVRARVPLDTMSKSQIEELTTSQLDALLSALLDFATPMISPPGWRSS